MQWCSDQTPNFKLMRWIIGTGQENSGGCSCTRLTARFSQTVKPFWRLISSHSIFTCSFLNVSFLFQNSTLLCRQNRIFVDMSYFLKSAVLSAILLTKHLSMTELLCTESQECQIIFNPILKVGFLRASFYWGGGGGGVNLIPPSDLGPKGADRREILHGCQDTCKEYCYNLFFGGKRFIYYVIMIYAN